MDEKMETKFAEGVEVEINKVSAQTNPKDVNEIMKVTFETNKGNITWKPKMYKVRTVSGMEIADKVPMTIEEMPEKLKKLCSETYSKGVVTMLVNYTVGTTKVDGEDRTYRFITSEKTFNDWKLIDESKIKEEVIE